MSDKEASKDVGYLSWSGISERLLAQRNEARYELDESYSRYKRSLEALQNSAGSPSVDFLGAIE